MPLTCEIVSGLRGIRRGRMDGFGEISGEEGQKKDGEEKFLPRPVKSILQEYAISEAVHLLLSFASNVFSPRWKDSRTLRAAIR